jgi:multicomponent Na+:H+ antiporter subunit B
MSTVILRTMTPALSLTMAVFSIIILLRGHNAPGGGFIGGLIASAAVAVYAMAFGVGATRKMLHVNPIAVAGSGVLVAALSGVVSAAYGVPFLTGLWLPANIFGVPGVFDVSVYFAVLGSISAIALALEDEGEAH